MEIEQAETINICFASDNNYAKYMHKVVQTNKKLGFELNKPLNKAIIHFYA